MIDLAELKIALRVGTGSVEDDYLAQLEEAAVATMERETHQYFGPQGAGTEYLIGLGTDRLLLATPPISGPTEVKERAYAGDATYTTITGSDATGFVVRGRELIRKAGGIWQKGYEYEVAYTRGYNAGAEPADVRGAVLRLCALWYEHRMPVATDTVVTKLPHDVQQVINRWKRHLV